MCFLLSICCMSMSLSNYYCICCIWYLVLFFHLCTEHICSLCFVKKDICFTWIQKVACKKFYCCFWWSIVGLKNFHSHLPILIIKIICLVEVNFGDHIVLCTMKHILKLALHFSNVMCFVCVCLHAATILPNKEVPRGKTSESFQAIVCCI